MTRTIGTLIMLAGLAVAAVLLSNGTPDTLLACLPAGVLLGVGFTVWASEHI